MINCLGFSYGHDANLLIELSKSGTKRGLFLYVQEDERIPIYINNLFNIVPNSSINIKLFTKSRNPNKIKFFESDIEDCTCIATVEFEKNEKTNELDCWVTVLMKDIKDCTYIAQVCKGATLRNYKLVFQGRLIHPEKDNIRDFVFYLNSFLASKIKHALENGVNEAKTRLKGSAILIDEARK